MNSTQKIVAIIEDDDVIREIYGIGLESAGYKVFTASTGEEGLKLLKDNKIDVVLLDMLMPDLNGIEFLKIYDPKKHQDVRVIGFSNLMDPAAMQEALDLGAEKYMLKSEFTPSKIAEFLQE